MQLDYQQFVTKLERLTRLRPLPERHLVENYVKAYYVPEAGLEDWVRQHTVRTQTTTEKSPALGGSRGGTWPQNVPVLWVTGVVVCSNPRQGDVSTYWTVREGCDSWRFVSGWPLSYVSLGYSLPL